MTTAPAPPAPDLRDPALYVNRELSWLDFNARVLALAGDPAMPLLERCKFLAITSSNLDEFFMVRVASVLDALEAGRKPSTPDQLARERVLELVRERTQAMVAEQGRVWSEVVRPALAAEGIVIRRADDLPEAAAHDLRRRFEREVFPVLTPLAVGPGLPFPYISGLSLNLGLTVRDPETGETRFARVKVPRMLPRLLRAGDVLVPLEQVIAANLDRVFPGMEITRTALFRVTRDADFEISDEADDLLGAVEAQVRRRRFGEPVRLEVEARAPGAMVRELRESLGVPEREVYAIDEVLDFTDLWQLYALDRPDLKERPWEPRTHPRLRGEADIFAAIRGGDILVHHPYDDFDTSVARFVEQATADPDVLAIKQTLYRTSGDTPIVPALISAAEQGKTTVCLVELKARFDEERNIQWAKALERAGVHVVYGLPGLKTHAKLCLVVRREGETARRYVHIGTGNYHPTTARLYTDLGLFTTGADLTEDVADLFNYLTGFARTPDYRRALVAPEGLRRGVVGEIDRVVEGHRAGVPGRIVMKLNAVIDGAVIRALYRASQAGVPVDLVVRGVCGLRAGVPGVSESIRVVSIVGRFLEHARILLFQRGDERRVFLGSADMMPRNLDNRVELISPVEDPVAVEELAGMLEVMLADTALAWELAPDGEWARVAPAPGAEPLNSQDELMRRTAARGAHAE